MPIDADALPNDPIVLQEMLRELSVENVAIVVCRALILWIMWQFARPPYDGMIGCPTNLPNCHDMPAPFPVEPWVVAAGFLGIVLVAWSQR